MTRSAASAMAERLPGHAAALKKAGERLAGRLEALAAEAQELGRHASGISFILQHDALSWLFHDAGLEVAFVLQAEAGEQPSAAEIAGIARTVKARKAGTTVLVAEPQFPARLVETLSRETGAGVVRLDPLASGPASPEPGYYEKVMAGNIASLRRLLVK